MTMKRFSVVLVISFALFGCGMSKGRLPEGPYKEPALVLPETTKPYSVCGTTYYPLPDGEGFVQEGIASWYGEEFHGKKTSNGETYNMYGETAAHKTLPFGTYVRVENLSDSKEVIVRINDRGPFAKQRIIDLSYGAAKKIGLVDPGTAPVRLTALSKRIGTVRAGTICRPLVEAKNFNEGRFTVQVGAFENIENAQRLAVRLRVIFDHVSITPYAPPNSGTFYRVRVSLSESLTEAGRIANELEYLGFSETFIVAL
jgi:rare lipoprotein A